MWHIRTRGALALLVPKHVAAVSLGEDAFEPSSSLDVGFTTEFDFCTIGFLQYEAQPLRAMQVRERNKEVLNTLMFLHRDDLHAACAAADWKATGLLPIHTWKRVLQTVLQQSSGASPMPSLPVTQSGQGGGVQYAALLGRIALAAPGLEPLPATFWGPNSAVVLEIYVWRPILPT